MKKIIKLFRFLIVLIIVLINLDNFDIISNSSAKPADLLKGPILRQRFNQYIDISYDQSILNKSITLDEPITLELAILYWTDAPMNLYGNILKYNLIYQKILKWSRLFLWMQKSYVLYGMPLPYQVLNISIVDKPDWADIILTSNQVNLNVPINEGYFKSVEYPPVGNTTEIRTSLIISPLEEAPAESYSIVIEVECEELGMLNGVVYRESIEFSPLFYPKINIKTETPVRIVKPLDSVNFNITAINKANKVARITPRFTVKNNDWNPIINPQRIEVDPGAEGKFFFSVMAPYNFGWHDEMMTFKINFDVELYPIKEGSEIIGPFEVELTIKNQGFSVPSFECYLLIIGIGICIMLKKKWIIV